MSLHKPLCPFCQSEASRVIDVRGTWRRRECLDCSTRFSTAERVYAEHEGRRDYKHRIPHQRQQPGLFA